MVRRWPRQQSGTADVAEFSVAGSAGGSEVPVPDAEATLAALHRRGDEAVGGLLRENEPHWRSLSEADRRTVESLARTIASRLLDGPAHRLEAEPSGALRAAWAQALHVLFALDPGSRSR